MIDAETYRQYGRTAGGIEFRTLPPANPNAEVDGDRGACGGVGGRDDSAVSSLARERAHSTSVKTWIPQIG
jgi:hypothetical protein